MYSRISFSFFYSIEKSHSHQHSPIMFFSFLMIRDSLHRRSTCALRSFLKEFLPCQDKDESFFILLFEVLAKSILERPNQNEFVVALTRFCIGSGKENGGGRHLGRQQDGDGVDGGGQLAAPLVYFILLRIRSKQVLVVIME